MFIAIISAIVAAVVGVPVVTKMLDATKEPKPTDDKLSIGQSKSSSQASLNEISAGERNPFGSPHTKMEDTIKVNPDTITPEQDPFADLDLQELAALTNSPALLQMMGLEQPAPSSATAPTPPTPQALPQSSKPKAPSASEVPKAQKPTHSSKKSLVSVNWEGEWSDPPAGIPAPRDEVERQRGTPSADALFEDSDVPVITKTPANYRRKQVTPSPKAPEPKSQQGQRPQKLREVAPTQNNTVGNLPAKPPLKLFVEDAPNPLSAQSPYEIIQPTRNPINSPQRTQVFQRATGSDMYGSARENNLDFQPFFALDALRIINEARIWTKSQTNRLSEVSREELGIIINEELPEWSLLLSHVNGFLFDLAQEQLRHRQMTDWGKIEVQASEAKLGGGGFRQSQWQNVPTEEFIAKSSKPQSNVKPRGPKRFMREG